MKLFKKKNREPSEKTKKKLTLPKILLVVVLLGSLVLVGASRVGFINLPIPMLSGKEVGGQEDGEQPPDGEEPQVKPVSAQTDPAEESGEPTEPQEPLPDRTDWRLLLINNDNFVPRDFRVNLTRVQGEYLVDERIAPELNRMISDAARDGVSLKMCSGYRNVRKQRGLFDEQINSYTAQGYGKEDALSMTMCLIARPGYSEHHIGLAVDIVTESYQKLDEGFADTAAYRYGFVLRYSGSKQSTTGISYEPWHYRYVGVEHAIRIQERGICLEEYLGVASTSVPQEPSQETED